MKLEILKAQRQVVLDTIHQQRELYANVDLSLLELYDSLNEQIAELINKGESK